MASLHSEAILPFTETARKYGYITWHKKADSLVRETLGEKDVVDLEIEGTVQRRKHIDWEKRRIGITWTVTRRVSPNAKKIHLQRMSSTRVSVRFV